MKRQGSSTGGQPPVKKPDASTDLRSKIGAKLQTLLNGLDTDSVLNAKKRKQLYEDLFGKPKYSEIIIDPTIVIKEEPDVEECSNDSSTSLNSSNFLLSAKSRLTELLNKQQDGGNKYKDSGKENALISSRNKSSSNKSNFSQNPSCSKSPSILYNSLNKNRNSTNKEHTNPSSNSTNLEDPAKSTVLEDHIKSKYRTRLRSRRPDHNITSSNVGSNLDKKQDKHLTLGFDNLVNKKASNLRSTRKSKSCMNSEIPISESSFIDDSSEINRSKSINTGSVLGVDASPSKSMAHDGILLNTEESVSDIPYYNETDSEMIDDPIIPQVIVDIKIGEGTFEAENSDSDIELVCEKKRVAEVITLEDNDEEVVECTEVSDNKKGNTVTASGSIHKCKECGKTFRAESLLNFHIKMHGKLSQSPSSNSRPFS